MRVEMIRTYTRKPQESQYIEGVMKLCRLCLKTAESAVPIFTDDPSNICSSFAMRIMICVGLDVKRDDSLPNRVCTDCCKELERYYAFRKRCEVSYQKLKSHLLATRSRQSEQEETKKETLNDKMNQDENMNDFGLMMMGEAEDNTRVLTELEPVISDIRTVNSVDTELTEVPQECRVIEPEELTGLITSVLVKLGILSQHQDTLSVMRPDVAKIQLDTGDGGVVRMELMEEDIEEAEPELKEELFVLEEGGSPPPAPPAPAAVPAAPDTRAVPPKGKKPPKIHTNIGAVACTECGRVLASRSALRRHLRTHSGERPFSCPRCQRSFAQKEVMLRHMLVHEAVRPHKCSTCNKSFTQRNALVLHERSHLPPHERALALHSCPHCPKLFLYSSGLSRHMMTHSGRVYVCGTCRRQFADKSSVLRHHRARHHAVPEPELEPGDGDAHLE